MAYAPRGHSIFSTIRSYQQEFPDGFVVFFRTNPAKRRALKDSKRRGPRSPHTRFPELAQSRHGWNEKAFERFPGGQAIPLAILRTKLYPLDPTSTYRRIVVPIGAFCLLGGVVMLAVAGFVGVPMRPGFPFLRTDAANRAVASCLALYLIIIGVGLLRRDRHAMYGLLAYFAVAAILPLLGLFDPGFLASMDHSALLGNPPDPTPARVFAGLGIVFNGVGMGRLSRHATGVRSGAGGCTAGIDRRELEKARGRRPGRGRRPQLVCGLPSLASRTTSPSKGVDGVGQQQTERRSTQHPPALGEQDAHEPQRRGMWRFGDPNRDFWII